MGLVHSLRTYLESFTQRTRIQTHFSASAEIPQLESSRRTALFRIVQATLSNIENFSEANSVNIKLRQESDNLSLSIHDDGNVLEGLNELHADNRDSHRLRLIRARIDMMQGYLEVTPVNGKGTTLKALIPINPATGNKPLH